MFMVDLVLFILFSLTLFLRLAIYWKSSLKTFSTNLDQLAFLACVPISWFTITGFVALVPTQAYWGRLPFTIVAYVMWWFGAAWMLLTTYSFYIILFRTSIVSTRNLSSTALLPALGPMMGVVIGGIICNFAADVSPGLAIPVVVFGLLMVGQGLLVSLMIYGLYVSRLVNYGWPDIQTRPSLMILVSSFASSHIFCSQFRPALVVSLRRVYSLWVWLLVGISAGMTRAPSSRRLLERFSTQLACCYR